VHKSSVPRSSRSRKLHTKWLAADSTTGQLDSSSCDTAPVLGSSAPQLICTNVAIKPSRLLIIEMAAATVALPTGRLFDGCLLRVIKIRSSLARQWPAATNWLRSFGSRIKAPAGQNSWPVVRVDSSIGLPLILPATCNDLRVTKTTWLAQSVHLKLAVPQTKL